jgi:hypothetical protein
MAGWTSNWLMKDAGRGERIRTSDLSVPNRAHYQAVLRPETSLTRSIPTGEAFYELVRRRVKLPKAIPAESHAWTPRPLRDD